MIYLVALVVLALANARAARLLSRDDITTPIRHWIDRRWGEDSFAARLVYCHWCAGVWTAGWLSGWAVAACAVWGGWSWGLAMAVWLPLTLAVAYAGARLVDLEGE